MIIDFYLCVLAVSVGIVYVENLTAPHGLLGFLDGEKVKHKKLRHLLTCPVCVTGQVALWGYLILHWSTYSLYEHLIIMFASMLASLIIIKYLHE